MIDLDAQASLTFSFITPDDWQKNFAENKTIKSWFDSIDNGSPLALADIIFTPQRAASVLRRRQGKLEGTSKNEVVGVKLDVSRGLPDRGQA